MADYYPLIARAVEALSEQSPNLRRAVYDRARTALTEQLRGLDPPVSEADIFRERLSLDAAIDRVEAEHGEPVTAPQPPPTVARLDRPGSGPPARPEPLPEAGPPVPPVPVKLRRPNQRLSGGAGQGPARAADGAASEAPQRERPRI